METSPRTLLGMTLMKAYTRPLAIKQNIAK